VGDKIPYPAIPERRSEIEKKKKGGGVWGLLKKKKKEGKPRQEQPGGEKKKKKKKYKREKKGGKPTGLTLYIMRSKRREKGGVFPSSLSPRRVVLGGGKGAGKRGRRKRKPKLEDCPSESWVLEPRAAKKKGSKTAKNERTCK